MEYRSRLKTAVLLFFSIYKKQGMEKGKPFLVYPIRLKT